MADRDRQRHDRQLNGLDYEAAFRQLVAGDEVILKAVDDTEVRAIFADRGELRAGAALSGS